MSIAKKLIVICSLFWAPPLFAHEVNPWTEAVVSVADIPSATRLFREAGDWRITHKGRVTRAELNYWNLPGNATATFQRICAPKADTGCIRFISFKNVPQRPIRLAARPWDTGGIFSIMIRSDDSDALFQQALALGWWAESEPINFEFGESKLRNIVLTGPHGINIAVYERRAPPFTGFAVGRMSQGFNMMRMVRNQKASVAFHVEKLGFSTLFNSDYLDPAPQVTNFSIPLNFSTIVARRAAAVYAKPGEAGRIELMEFVGFQGRDFMAHAAPPNLGILSARFPVSDLTSYSKLLSSRGVSVVYRSEKVPIAGIGLTDIFAIRDLDGNLSEFYEVVEGQK